MCRQRNGMGEKTEDNVIKQKHSFCFSSQLSAIHTGVLIKWLIGLSGFAVTFLMLAWGLKTQWVQGSDFSLRFHEALNVRNGVDPFNLGGWTYPPWEYVFAEPFTWVPFNVAYSIFLTSNLILVVLILLFSYHLCVKYCHNIESGVLGAGLALCSVNFAHMIAIENYGIYCCCGIILMLWAMNTNKKILAGIGWALVMLKPQLGVLFIIPLLVRREWKVIITAVSICIAGTLIAALQVGKMPLALLIETVQGNAVHFSNIDTYKLYSILFYFKIPSGIAYAMSWLTSFAVVSFCNWQARNVNDAFFIMLPAIVCGTFTGYVGGIDWVVLFTVIIWAVYLLQHLGIKKGLLPFAGLLFLVAVPRFFRLFNDLAISIHNIIRYGGLITALLLFYSSKKQLSLAQKW